MTLAKTRVDQDAQLIGELRERLVGDKRLAGGLTLARLRREPDGMILIEGDVDRVAQKKIALEIVAAHPAILGIVDRLRVRPAEAMSDAGIRSHLRKILASDVTLRGLSVDEVHADRTDTILNITEPTGNISYEVADGVVTLNGRVSDLAVKRYLGVLAWWVPGTRDVINGIVAASDEADGPDRIADALRAVLEKDPFVDASQVKVGVRGRVVRLTGFLRSEAERQMAENDAWYIFGVDDVINEITVQ